ncbi:hypothetical protein AAE478_003192 [Parahypoxylon ruwenzoriense]
MPPSIDPSTPFRVDEIVAIITRRGIVLASPWLEPSHSTALESFTSWGRRLGVLETAAQKHTTLDSFRCDAISKEDLQAAVDHITPGPAHDPFHQFLDGGNEKALNVNVKAAFSS